MTKDDLKQIFESPFDWDNWRKVMDFVFPEFNFSAQKIPVDQFTKAAEEHITGFFHHGSTPLADHVSLNLYEVGVKGSVNLSRNVKGIRKFIANEAIANTQASIAVFYSPDRSKWRFTLAVKQLDENFKQTDRKPESYTYVFGVNEKGRTAASRFAKLANEENKKLADLEAAFSVTALSKKFFEQYKAIYGRFVSDIVQNPSKLSLFKNDDQEKGARDFVKKMMGRMVFLYFLQKKGWMGCQTRWSAGNENFMHDLFNEAPEDDNFYTQYLEPLFFETLNARREAVEEDCMIAGKSRGKVPFLNGGLFEREPGHPENLTLQWQIFHDFFDVLDEFNFTIIEDDPDFKEVAVDPEMLGHIFENLLEDNKDKGAFYTPKEIVQYMCQESLIEYLNTKLSEHTKNDHLKDAIRVLVLEETFGKLNQLDQDADRHIFRALKDIKVCDPAIGSGAFPMGILHEIFRLLERLAELNPDVFTSVWEISWNAAAVKEAIIQNSIYGVDIEKGAVDIARLRFWLSIIIDEETPKPLPNLDYKIMQGNSLLEQYEGIPLDNLQNTRQVVYEVEGDKQMDMFGKQEGGQISFDVLESRLDDLYNHIDEYFISDEPERKSWLKNQISEIIHDHLHFNIDLRKGKHEVLLAETQASLSGIQDYPTDSEAKREQKEKKQATLTNLIAKHEKEIERLQTALLELDQIQDTNDRPYFLWNLMFRDVFEAGGFDIVIGNPPYVSLETFDEKTKANFKNQGYNTLTGRGDIYCLFYEKSISILRKSGILTFITSNKWMRSGYGFNLRDFLVKHVGIKKLIDFGDAQHFENATTYTNIMIASKGNEIANPDVADLSSGYNFNISLLQNLEEKNHSADFSENSFLIVSDSELAFKKKIEENGVLLREWDIEITSGIKTGYNEAFVINESLKEEFISNDESNRKIIAPLLRGRDIKRYKSEFQNLWIILAIFGSNKFLKTDHEIIFQHLEKYESPLSKRGQCTNRNGTGQHHWLELDNNPTESYLAKFNRPKLIWLEMSPVPNFAYSEKSEFVLNTAYILNGDNLKYILGVLNSKVLHSYFGFIAPDVRGKTRRYTKQYVEQLPIPQPSEDFEKKISFIVDQIIDAKNQSKDTLDLEKQLDLIVFKLYNLTFDEVLVAEPDFWLSEEEYDNFSLDVEV